MHIYRNLFSSLQADLLESSLDKIDDEVTAVREINNFLSLFSNLYRFYSALYSNATSLASLHESALVNVLDIVALML